MSRNFLFALVALVCLILAGLSVSAPAQPNQEIEPQKALETMYTLGSGDKLQINVYGQEDLSGEYTVTGSGYISFPLIGELKVKDLTLRDLEKRLVQKLSDGYLVDPKVSLQVLNYRPFYILGEVNEPGKYEYVSGITLNNAVAMAGGYTHRAKRNSATITRANSTVIEGADHSTLILPGDTIEIPEKFF